MRLKEDKIKLTGVIIGQLGRNSRDRVEKTNEGKEAIDKKDPLVFIKTIVATHLVSSKLDNEDNFYQSNVSYSTVRMNDSETIESYHRRFRSIVGGMTQAAKLAAKEASVPDEKMQAIHFVNTLSANFSEYKNAYDRNMLKAKPNTVEEAYQEAVNFGADKRQYSARKTDSPAGGGTRAGVFVATDKVGGGRGGGRGRGSRGNGGGRGTGGGGAGGAHKKRGRCVICNEEGHWKNECPQREKSSSDADLEKAIKEASKEKANK